MAKKVDWRKIKKEYVTTDISQRELSQKYSVSSSQIANHSKKEKWVEKRKQYQSKVYAKSVEKQEAKDIDHLMKVRSATESMSTVINTVLQKAEKMSGMNIGYAGEIKDMTTAIKNLAVTIRDLYDLPNMQDRSSMDIARERLALDKSRDMMSADDEDEIGVLMLAERGEDDDDEEETKHTVETATQTD